MSLYTGSDDTDTDWSTATLPTTGPDMTAAMSARQLEEGPLAQVGGIAQLWAAKAAPPLGPDLPIAQAKKTVKDKGLDSILELPEQDTINQRVFNIMMDRAEKKRERDNVIARGPSGFMTNALATTSSFLVGAADPLNLAVGLIPVIGEVRYGKMLLGAGETALARGGAAALRHGTAGAVGMAALQPIDWYARTQEGQDFTMAEALTNIMYGAGLGATLGGLGRVVGDIYRSRSKLPVYMPENLKAGLISDVFKNEPKNRIAPLEQTPFVDALVNLPPRVKEDLLHANLALMIDGKPVRAGEMLQAIRGGNPQVAETLARAEGVQKAHLLDLTTGKPEVDAILATPEVRDELANVKINRGNDVPYGAGASEKNNKTINIDKSIPERDVINGVEYDPARPAAVHELIEKRVMQALIEAKKKEVGRELTEKEMDAIYKTAHFDYAEPAEKAWVESVIGPGTWDQYQANWATWLKPIEHENPKNPPKDLYQKPYPHDNVHLAPQTKETEFEGTTTAVTGKARGARAKPEQEWSLLEFIASKGGVHPEDQLAGDVRQMTGGKPRLISGFGTLVGAKASKKGAAKGVPLDTMREMATEAGYLPGEMTGGQSTTINQLLEAMDRELRGDKVYRAQHQAELDARARARPAAEEEQHHYDNLVHEAVQEAVDAGLVAKEEHVTKKMRKEMLDFIRNEKLSPGDALERVILGHRQIDIENKDVKDFKNKPIAGHHPEAENVTTDTGTAQAGSEGAGERQVAEGAAVREPPQHRGTDVGEGTGAATEPTDLIDEWHRIAAEQPAYNNPDLIALSEAVGKEKPPASLSEKPSERLKKAQAEDDFSAQQYAEQESHLPEDLRAKVEAELIQLDQEAADRTTVIQKGIGCLSAAVGA